jgi:hypothetical protein
MMRIYSTIFGLLLVAGVSSTSYADGFLAGTLVKVPGGYKAIETLNVGDDVCCRNAAGDEEVRSITTTRAQHPEVYIALKIEDQELVTEKGQLFMSSEQAKVPAGNLTPSTPLVSVDAKKTMHLAQAPTTPMLEKTPLLYNIMVKEHHTFFVTKKDICVHNNAASIAFGFKKPAPIVAPSAESTFDPLEHRMPQNLVGKSAFRGPNDRPSGASQAGMYKVGKEYEGRGNIWTGNCDAYGNPIKTQAEKDAEYCAQVSADNDHARALKKEHDDSKAHLVALISKPAPVSKKTNA